MTRQAARGFTLLEVLVALAVLAIALGAIIKTMSGNAYNSTYLRDRTLAHWVAMNEMTDLQLRQDWPAAGKTDGTAVLGNREWYWETEIKPTSDNDVEAITVRVRSDRDARDPITTLQGYIGRKR